MNEPKPTEPTGTAARSSEWLDALERDYLNAFYAGHGATTVGEKCEAIKRHLGGQWNFYHATVEQILACLEIEMLERMGKRI